MKSIYKFLMVAATAATLTSCLKDKNIDDQVYGMTRYDQGKIVELPAPPNHFIAIGLNLADRDTTFAAVTVGLAADQVAQEDIKVNLTLANSSALITEYNNANGTGFIQLPSSEYALQGTGLSVTIPKGQRFGTVNITLNPNDLDPSEAYALGFKIASIETSGYTISGNFGTVVVGILVKNRFDGVYEMRFHMLDWLAAHGIDNTVVDWGGPIHMESTGANSVKLFDDWGFGTYIHPAATPTAYTGFGSTEPKFFFDLTTNKLINVTNDFTNPSNGRQFFLNTNPTDWAGRPIDSKWDPATGNIYAAIILKQPGRTDLYIYDTFFYVGPRP